MYAFVVLVGLALGLAVLREVIDELVPVKAPRALGTTISAGIAILVAWGLDYSLFRAFGQPLRTDWMNPVATGLVLVGAGEFLRPVSNALAGIVRTHTGTGTGTSARAA